MKTLQSALDSQFPPSGCAYEHLVFGLFEGLQCFSFQKIRTSEPPQNDMRISQYVHGFSPLNAARMSSGSGSSKLGPILIFPFRAPAILRRVGRGCRWRIGTNLA